tara:strand:+ start:538 stop:699 length:162 start_codon:yes stop_codon:yes gene_type:complete
LDIYNKFLKRITVNLEEYLHRKMKILAAERDSTLNDVMIEAAKMYLQNKSKYS